jgi:hypothetical protein
MRISLLLAGVAAAGLVSGCGTTQRVLGLEKSAPDEFRVITKAPLVVPPDYALRPPRPGEARPGPADATAAAARAAVFGTDIGARATEGEKLIVAKAGAGAVDPMIRTQVDFEGGAIVHKSDAYSDKLIAKTPTASTPEEEESIRRATGGGAIKVEGGNARPSKLPGL